MIAATPDLQNGTPRVLIEVDSGDGTPITSVVVRRDGVPLLEQPIISGPDGYTYDYIPPYGVPVTYSAIITTATETTTSSSTVTVDSQDGYMINPRKPAFSFRLSADHRRAGVVTLGERVNPARAVEHESIGNNEAIVVTMGSRGADQRTITVGTVSRNDRDTLDQCLSDETPLMVRFPAAWDMDFREAFYKFGDSTKAPLVEIAGNWINRWSFPIKQVRAPKIVVQAVWTLQDVIDNYLTLQDVIDAYPTLYAEILNDPRS